MNIDNKFNIEVKVAQKARFMLKFINHFLYKFGLRLNLEPIVRGELDMVSKYQLLNFYHLLNRVIANKVNGVVVELGCYTGQSASQLQIILDKADSEKQLFLFDNFAINYNQNNNTKGKLITRFKNLSLKTPNIIEGDIMKSVPDKLPNQIAFLHIDLGYGNDKNLHKELILYCLEHCYNKMEPGSIGVLMDYHDEKLTVGGTNSNPGVKLACDDFFSDKPEKVYVLYGGEYSHGYFIKGTNNI